MTLPLPPLPPDVQLFLHVLDHPAVVARIREIRGEPVTTTPPPLPKLLTFAEVAKLRRKNRKSQQEEVHRARRRGEQHWLDQHVRIDGGTRRWIDTEVAEWVRSGK